MKLKKIASLMLAGIMAVSMLAACGEGKKDDSSSSSSSQVTTSNAVAYANDALNGKQKEIFSFSNSDELNKALNAVATDSKVFTSGMIKTAYAKVDWTSTADETNLTSKLAGKFNGIKTTVSTTAGFFNVPADKDSQKAIYAYTMSGALDEKVAVEKVVTAIANNMNRSYYPATIGNTGDKYDCEYTANISSIKVAAPDNAGETAWVIGIVITQNVSSVVG